jgi:glycosyltransferase involved in cell wall biosynthesis
LVEPHTSKIARYCTRFALKRADLILVAGERLIAPAINLGANTDKISLLPVGVDTKEFTLRETSSGTKETPARITTVISTRNLNPIYNLETLVRAIPLVLKQVPQTNFIIIGDGVQKIYLQDLAKSLGVIDKVEFTGHLPHNQLPGYLASADVYVSTSLSDGSSVSMLEAMSCGPAPIVTDVGDVRNWITDGINGFIIPTKRPDLLATHIIQLLKDNEFRKKIKTLNRRIVEARADYQNNMSKMEKTYEQLVEAFNNK